MFVVVISNKDGDKEYEHVQLKIAERQFEQYKAYPETRFISIVHSLRRHCEVIKFWERPAS